MYEEKVPQYLGAPYQILWWETDDLGVIFFSYIASTSFGVFLEISLHALISWAVLIGPYCCYRYYKKRYPSGFLGHFAYFIGLKTLKHQPAFFEKVFFE